MTEKPKNLGLRAEFEKHQRLKQWALDHQTTVQGIFDKLTDELLSDVNHSGEGTSKGKNSIESAKELKDNSGIASIHPWGEMLVKILTSDKSVLENREAIEAVQQNLRVFYRHIGGDPDGDFQTTSDPGANLKKGTARINRAKKPPSSDRKNIPEKA